MLCFLQQLVKAVCVLLLLLMLGKASSNDVVGMVSGMRRSASTNVAYKDVERSNTPSAAQGHFCEEEILQASDHIHQHAQTAMCICTINRKAVHAVQACSARAICSKLTTMLLFQPPVSTARAAVGKGDMKMGRGDIEEQSQCSISNLIPSAVAQVVREQFHGLRMFSYDLRSLKRC